LNAEATFTSLTSFVTHAECYRSIAYMAKRQTSH